MKLTIEGIKDRAAWEKAGIALPGYDVEKISEKAKEEPGWVHFGIGNIFRIFIGGIADGLLEEGVLDRGITCVETFDYDVVDKIYDPYDNLGLSVILHGDGTREYKVLGSLAEAVKAQSSDLAQWNRLKEIFTSKSLQMVSFTITEKGYALQKADGTWFPFVEADIKNGPDKATGAMAVLVAMLYERFKAGRYPIALVSMDNCSKNGAKLRESVLTMAEEWKKQGFVDDDFITYVNDEKVVAFPWTMIDKITPRPSEQIADDLEALGVEKMQPVITGKKTYIAPFVNAEKPQYLVIEDSFPNGRPALEKGFGVYMADRNTVNLSERMKVTVCLNPVHSATGPLGVVLGYDLFAHMLNTNEDMMKMANKMLYHIVKRVPHAMCIYEAAYDYIDIENIEVDENRGNANSIYFTDGKHTYHFSRSKNTLYMIFDNMELMDEFEVQIYDDPYDILSNAMRLKTGAEKIIHKQEAGGLEDKKPCLCLRLYSTKQDGTKFVAEKSGLNQWNGVRSCYKKDKETGERIKVKETPRDVNELYIPYPSIDRNRESFFPPRDTAFELRLPDGEWISAKVCQQDGKAIMSNPNNLLGKWLLRDVLELQEGTQITYEMLKEYGIDSVMFTKLDEGKYSIDFCELGTYEKVYGLEDIDAKNDVSDE